MSTIVTTRGYVDTGISESFDVTLSADETYAIYVDPADPTVDLDLHVYDDHGARVAVDEDLTSDALCLVTPAQTGPFRILVNSASGSSTFDLMVIRR